MERAADRKARVAEELAVLYPKYEQYFTSAHQYTFLRKIGSGVNAQGLLFQTTSGEKRVVKFAYSAKLNKSDEADPQILNERDVLARLGHSEHIVQLIGENIDESKIPRPALVVEYLNNGTLKEFCQKIDAIKKPVPNLTRAAIGMAYPPWQGGERETIKTEQNPSCLMHADFHDENVLFDDLTVGDIEHKLVLVLKVIDFSKAEFLAGQAARVEAQHVYDIARLVTAAIRKKYAITRDENQTLEVLDSDGNNPTQMVVFTDPILWDDPNTHLLAELRHLLLRCQTPEEDWAKRPTLKQVLDQCERAVRTYLPLNYAGIVGYDVLNETDDRIRDLLQQTIFDAPQDDPPPTGTT
ncbi:hypothetical protein F5Y16DRAFT_405035 [Xylariaceae sp. FL0255]|nr:hypothetical protein F5Y16DRAFT_405035 [Xylariaceae sp. FL0255]